MARLPSGAATYRHNVRQRRDLLVPLGVVSIIGAVLGTVALLTAPDSVFRALVPFLVLGATAVIALQPRISAWLTAAGPSPCRWAGGLLETAATGASVGTASGCSRPLSRAPSTGRTSAAG
ncbi:TSUP family transporter [Luedemannella flava]